LRKMCWEKYGRQKDLPKEPQCQSTAACYGEKAKEKAEAYCSIQRGRKVDGAEREYNEEERGSGVPKRETKGSRGELRKKSNTTYCTWIGKLSETKKGSQ